MSRLDLPDRCFHGLIPAMIATCSKDGVPNVTYLSQVFRIDERHVALSCQFFNKTKQNVLEVPFATVELLDPVTLDAFRLALRYDHSETSGPLFEQMDLRIEAIASQTGMKGVFKLIAADVYELLGCERRADFLTPAPAESVVVEEPAPGPRSELKSLQLISQRTCRAPSLESLLTATLSTLDEALGFTYSMVLLPDEAGKRLFTVASRGYGEEGVGAELEMGEGLIGTAALQQKVLCISGMEAELRYGRAIRSSAQHGGVRREIRPEIPLPGLPDAQSLLVLPLVANGRLVGVLVAESRERMGFEGWDEAFLEIVANQCAVAFDNALLREGSEEHESEPVPVSRLPSVPEVRARRFRFYRNDDCVFVGDDYLIRNVPGRILWKILRSYRDSGRTDFSNRELRLDPWLGLPPVRDNLESRLVLLRKRLEQKVPELRLVPTSRGHFRLETSCQLTLEETEGSA